jgi:hypothetical protein
MKEFKGSYYLCDKCIHIWDYEDDSCPNCGCKKTEEINSKQVEAIIGLRKFHISRLEQMLRNNGY